MSQNTGNKRGRKKKISKDKVPSNIQIPIINHLYESDDEVVEESSYCSESTVNSENELHNMIDNIPFLDNDEDKVLASDQNMTSFNRLTDVFNVTHSKRPKRVRKIKSMTRDDDSEYLTDDKEDVKQIIEDTGGNINVLLDKLEEKEQKLEKRRLSKTLKNKVPQVRTSKLKELRKCMMREKLLLRKRMTTSTTK